MIRNVSDCKNDNDVEVNVGESDGTIDGNIVGLYVGDKDNDGIILGDTDETIDGNNVGTDVGKTDVSDDGSDDGNIVGSDVGNEDDDRTIVGETDRIDGSKEDDGKKDESNEDEGTDDGVYVQSRQEVFVHLLSINISELEVTWFTLQLHKRFPNDDTL